MNYNALTRRHFESAMHAGILTGPGVRRGAAGSRSLGAWVQFDLQFDVPVDGQNDPSLVRAARFQAFGCPHVIAVADWVAEQSEGLAAQRQLPESLAGLKALFSVPTEKLGRLLVIEDAWIAALSSPSSTQAEATRR